MHLSSSLFFALTAHVAATAIPAELTRRSSYHGKFDQLIAFGDELSDNGSGSYAHGKTGGTTVYGYPTWTNGKVAVQYLAENLGVPLGDFAFGGCCGGGQAGATLDDSYTEPQAGAQSLVQQVGNYTGREANIKHALQFIWIGENDLSAHTDAFWAEDPKNAAFATQFADRVTAQVDRLINKGAPYVFVANIYPKHLAPVTAQYLCGTDAKCVTTFGNIIKEANAALEKKLKAAHPYKVIYYDVFNYVCELLENKDKYGYTLPLTNTCDDQGDTNWDLCMEDGHASEFFWMNFIQPTTSVHKLIGKNMKAAIDKHLGI